MSPTQATSIGLGLDGLKSQPKTHNQVTWFITINHQDHNPCKLGPNCLYIRLNKLYLHIIVVNKKHPVCSSFSPTSFITFVVSYFFQLLFFFLSQNAESLLFHSCLTKKATRQQRERCHSWGSYHMCPFLLFFGLFLGA